jgi:hypothetical protein
MTDVLEEALPELMRRATDGLEPDTSDLVARGMRQGVRLRRRRTAGIAVAAASAMVLSTGAVTFAVTRGGAATPDGAPVAGSVSPSPAASRKAAPVKETKTLATLRALLPKNLRLSEPKTRGDNLLANVASVIADDGRGGAFVEVAVGWKSNDNCGPKPGEPGFSCTRLPDGSALTMIWGGGGEADNFVKANHVRLHRRNGSYVMITSTNTRSMDHGPATRTAPVLSIDQLKQIIQDPRWTPPPRRPGTIQDNDLDPALLGHR